jgi:AraC-like DNA-binding protein
MATVEHGGNPSHFSLVTRGHHFLLQALPLRLPESRSALAMFVKYVEMCGLPPADIDAVLLRCLTALDRHTCATGPTLVERYLARGTGPADCGARFAACVEELLRYRGVGDPLVARAIACVEERYGDRDLKRALATEFDVTPAVLSDAFKRATALTLTEHIRTIRLFRAATLLVHSNKRIKEIWAEVGYNDASNFGHEFEYRFKVSPREYRRRATPVVPHMPSDALPSTVRPRLHQTSDDGRRRVLIVDDDELLMRQTAAFLRLHGSFVAEASSANEGLRELARRLPDAVLLDYRMGDATDGIACLGAMRQMPFSRAPGVALFTADWNIYDRADEVHRLEALIVPKPCDLDDVQQVVVYLSAA